MKKFLALMMAAALMMPAASLAAEEAAPQVMVNGRTIVFRQDQPPVIQNDRLYVPVRRVLEEMGARVSWNGETKTVTVSSYDNINKLHLTIDNPEITQYTYTSVLNADKKIIESDVAPVIINERTMLPIRVIAEALGSTVHWNEETLLTSITTEQAKQAASGAGIDASAEDFVIAEAYKETSPKISISCSAEEVNKDDVVTVNVHVTDLTSAQETAKLCSTIVSVFYDEENFSFKDYAILNKGEVITPEIIEANPDFMPGCLKIFPLVTSENAYLPGEDGVVMQINFTALNDNGGAFALSDGISELGSNTALITTAEAGISTYADYDELYIDTTPVEIK
ncbi:MAG: copper amine oxidase N-terminal domain-containing protein [Clostridia bacterium]|nr:copper amine oxidase N-terminal domain-containing protein [Clostridia bacterium]